MSDNVVHTFPRSSGWNEREKRKVTCVLNASDSVCVWVWTGEWLVYGRIAIWLFRKFCAFLLKIAEWQFGWTFQNKKYSYSWVWMAEWWSQWLVHSWIAIRLFTLKLKHKQKLRDTECTIRRQYQRLSERRGVFPFNGKGSFTLIKSERENENFLWHLRFIFFNLFAFCLVWMGPKVHLHKPKAKLFSLTSGRDVAFDFAFVLIWTNP